MFEQHRRTSTILFADIEGYTRLMQQNESEALGFLQRFKETLEREVPRYHGSIIQYYGDACLVTFDQPVQAVGCAESIQRSFQSSPTLPVRMGIHFGEVVFQNGNVFGDTVNIASRIESMGVPGAVLMSESVSLQVEHENGFAVLPMGSFSLKNIAQDVKIMALVGEGMVVPDPKKLEGKGVMTTKKAARKRLQYGLVALTLLALAGLSFFGYNRSGLIQPSNDLNALTVFPFEVKGSTDIAYLGEAMVDLISTKLDGIPGINPIDPNRVFTEVNGDQPMTHQLEKATRISDRLGASEFIIGNIVELNNTLEITATKYNRSGNYVSKKTIHSDKDNLAQSIDLLTRTLINEEFRDQGVENNSLAAMTTDDLGALKAFLLGEQAFRDGNINLAYQNYEEAVAQDSTFALAWLRMSDASSWNPDLNDPKTFEYAERYKKDLPQKWQDLMQLRVAYMVATDEVEQKILKFIKKYGETREFTNRMAEFLFHHNPTRGRSYLEAKPWLEKTLALDPNNMEALIHLADIAFAEDDQRSFDQIMEQIPYESEVWPRLASKYFSLQDSVAETDITRLLGHPEFSSYMLGLFMIAPEDARTYYDYALQFVPSLEKDWMKRNLQRDVLWLEGREEEALALTYDRITISTKGLSTHMALLPATLIGGKGFFPLSAYYPIARDKLRGKSDPAALFAQMKYSLALDDKPPDYELLKESILAGVATDSIFSPSKYFYFSLLAYEARLEEQNLMALSFIDSAFQYSPGFWEAEAYAVDKIFMLADIHEELGNYAEGIKRLENIPVTNSFLMVNGYCNYRLSRLYEMNGQTEKALAKCDLVINDYKYCDEQYRPWVDECIQRRERLQQVKG